MNEIRGLCHASHSALVVIDIQDRLAKAMPPADLDRFTRNVSVLLQGAVRLDIPVLSTEQYPKGLGETLPEIRKHQPASATCLSKTGFSCCSAAGFTQSLTELQRPQVILTGMETHICVLQTAFELKQQGFEVFVAEDAVCARDRNRNLNGLNRMRQAGISITHSESVLFEWLRDASHPQFKILSSLLK
jgi:nicotinamidase-related amidase